MNHRAVQRTLFRMQLDPDFVPGAEDGLGAEELALLRRADPVALSADREGRRRAQFLRNVTEEFALSCAAGVPAEGFASSPELHDAVRADASLPLAFGRYAERCSATGLPAQRALVVLELALARARREPRACVAPAAGELALAPWAWLVSVPEGTLDLAARLRAALDGGEPVSALRLEPGGDETVLVLAEREPAPFRLRAVEAELVSPDLAHLLASLERPRTRRALGGELDAVLAELRADGVLIGSAAAASASE
jgi:hypothetical protein